MLVYTIVILIVLTGFVSLAVDYGRTVLAKSELQYAVDAAARYASNGLADGTYVSKAQTAASENSVDGAPFALLSSDIVSGTWNSTSGSFTAGGSSPNAIQITGRRSAARGNAIPLTFGAVLGANSIDVTATATVVFTAGAAAYDIVGLTTVNLTGGTSIKRNSGESGTVNVATNGTTNVPNGCYIYGNSYYRTSAPSEPGNGITGTNTAMTADITLATPTIPGNAIDLGAINVGWQGGSISGGTYKCSSITLGGGGTFTVTGNVNIYCTGAISIGNGATINTSGTTNKVTIYLPNATTADFNMSSTFYMILYGPTATLNLTGSSPMIGSCAVKNLNLTGSATLSYSSALPIPTSGGASAAATVSTVK